MGLPEDRPEMSDEDWVNERLYGLLVHLPPLGLSTVSRRPAVLPAVNSFSSPRTLCRWCDSRGRTSVS